MLFCVVASFAVSPAMLVAAPLKLVAVLPMVFIVLFIVLLIVLLIVLIGGGLNAGLITGLLVGLALVTVSVFDKLDTL